MINSGSGTGRLSPAFRAARARVRCWPIPLLVTTALVVATTAHAGAGASSSGSKPAGAGSDMSASGCKPAGAGSDTAAPKKSANTSQDAAGARASADKANTPRRNRDDATSNDADTTTGQPSEPDNATPGDADATTGQPSEPDNATPGDADTTTGQPSEPDNATPGDADATTGQPSEPDNATPGDADATTDQPSEDDEQQPNAEAPAAGDPPSPNTRAAPARSNAPASTDAPVVVAAPQDDLPVIETERVVVTGSRTEKRLADTPVATEVIDRDEITAMGAENMADILEEHPALDVFRSFRGAGVRVQGLDPEYVLILVNGERVAGRVGGVIDLQRFTAEQIQRVEIVRGPSSALYGSDAIGGVINIITKRGKRPVEANARASYGSYNTADLNSTVSVSGDQWSSRTTAGWHRADAFDLNPDTEATTSSAFNILNVTNQSEWSATDAVTFSSNLEYRLRNQAGVDQSGGGAVFDRLNRTETLLATLGSEIFVGEQAKLELSAHYTQFRDQFVQDQRNSTALDQRQDTREQLGQLTAQYNQAFGASHFLSVGLTGLYESLRSQRLSGGRGNRQRVAIFAQHEWTILQEPRLVLVPGARVDIDSQFGTAPTPKLTARFDPIEDLTLRATYGWGFRAPSFKQLLLIFENPSAGYVVQGNPNLQPETSRSVNFGVEYKPFDVLWGSINVYRNDIENLIFTQTLNSDSTDLQRIGYSNIASAYTQGVETSVRAKLLRGLRLDIGYTLTDTYDRQRNRPLEGRALHRGTASLRYRNSAWGLDCMLRSRIVGRRPFYFQSESDTPEFAEPYSTIDVRFDKRFTVLDTELSVFAGGENLLNAGDPIFLPIQPRTFYAGLGGNY